MKYLIISDFHYIKKNRSKILLYYFIVLFIGIFFKLSTGYLKSDYTFSAALGLNFEIGDIISMLIFLIQQIALVMLVIDIMSKDITKNMSNIFLRVNMLKWIISKILTIFILNMILKTIMYIFAISVDMIINNSYYLRNIGDTIIWYCKDNIYTLLICLLSLMIYITLLSDKDKIFISFTIGIIYLIIKVIKYNPIKTNFIIPIISISIIIVLLVIILNLKKEKVLERWN